MRHKRSWGILLLVFGLFAAYQGTAVSRAGSTALGAVGAGITQVGVIGIFLALLGIGLLSFGTRKRP